MGEKHIPHQHGQGIPPLSIQGGPLAALVGSIHDVVVDEARDMAQLHDHGQVDMIGNNPACGSRRQKGECGPEARSAAADGLCEVMLDPRIDHLGLLADPLLHGIEVGTDQFDRLRKCGAGLGVNLLGGPTCGAFHLSHVRRDIPDRQSVGGGGAGPVGCAEGM